MAIQGLSGVPPMDSIRHHNQNVQVAVWSHLTASGGAKQKDPSGVDRFNDPPYQFVEGGLFKTDRWFHHCSP
jgi:hypothetical protein